MSGLRIVKVTNFVFAEMLRGAARPYSSDLPDDIEVVGVLETALDRHSQQFEIVCRSAEWDQPAEGACIPSIEPIFTTHYAPLGSEAPHVST